MNLECRFRWEKEIAEGDDYVLMCHDVWQKNRLIIISNLIKCEN